MFGVLWCGKLQDCGRYLRILVTILIENKQKYEYCINGIRWYNMIVTAPILVQEGGDVLEFLLSFILSIVASVIAYYICKWLDGEE